MKNKKTIIIGITTFWFIMLSIVFYIKSNNTFEPKNLINLIGKNSEACFKTLKINKSNYETYTPIVKGIRENYVLKNTEKIHKENFYIYLNFYNDGLYNFDYSNFFENRSRGYDFINLLKKDFDKKYGSPTTHPGMGLINNDGSKKTPTENFYETWNIGNSLELELRYDVFKTSGARITIRYGKPQIVPSIKK